MVSSSVLVDDGRGLTGAALVDQLAVPDHGVTVLDVVDVDLPHGVGAVEELGLAGQVTLERGKSVERGALEVVAATPVSAAAAASAVGRLTSTLFSAAGLGLEIRVQVLRVAPITGATKAVGHLATILTRD